MKRVVLVDDELLPLDALRRSLYRAKTKWQMVFVDSAEAAIAELTREPCDVIVTDIRMPNMDGTELLKVVNDRWPQTIRIAMSGYDDGEQGARLVPLVHQFLSKPCTAESLEGIVERCFQLQELLSDQHLRSIVGGVRHLPGIPRIYSRLNELMSREDPTVAEVAAVVTSDSALAAKVLHIVNSAFFRLARPINRIDQAVSHLGFAAIKNLALSAEVFSQWPAVAVPEGFEPERLQEHAQEIAAAAYALAKPAKWADDAMLAGLLHDIGYWILLQYCPHEISKATQIVHAQHISQHEAEIQVMGTSHAPVGAYLLGLWGLSPAVVEAVALHHDPLRVRQTQFDALAALSVAHVLWDAGTTRPIENPEHCVSKIDAGYLSALTSGPSWSEAEARIDELRGRESAGA